ncbi:MAG TPA: BamA/TamA family outer membrane protein, partial [Cyclobacteriaceae bacterium]
KAIHWMLWEFNNEERVMRSYLNLIRWNMSPGFVLAVILAVVMSSAMAQSDEKQERKTLMLDTLDGKFDFSRALVEVHGFIPVPMIITEPALGNIGGLLALVFIKPYKKIEGHKGYVPPDITAGIGMYTANGTYGLGAFRMGSFPKQGIKYRVGAFYGDINLAFYRTLPQVGEKEFNFNIQALPVFFSLSKKILKQDVYLGLKYSYANALVKPKFEGEVPAVITDKELDSNTATLGVFIDWDKRDNIFTPDKGYRFNIEYDVNASWTASDYEYQQLNTSFTWFTPVKSKWVSGLRLEVQHVFDRPPFYLMPSINMRGIPAVRYQGETTLIAETEHRIDLNPRWSVLGFVGLGKAIEFDQSFSEGSNVYSVGSGFRYLLARVFKIRAGIDVAVGPDSFGYYIVFGHNWNR